MLPSAQLAASPELQGLRFLVTSRVPLEEGAAAAAQERRVGAISYIAACQLVASIAEDLSNDQAGQVAAACHCTPLYLRLVAEALVAGRLTIEVSQRPLATCTTCRTGGLWHRSQLSGLGNISRNRKELPVPASGSSAAAAAACE